MADSDDDYIEDTRLDYVQINSVVSRFLGILGPWFLKIFIKLIKIVQCVMKIVKQVESERQSGGCVVGSGYITGFAPDTLDNSGRRALQVTDCFTLYGPVLPNDDDIQSEGRRGLNNLLTQIF